MRRPLKILSLIAATITAVACTQAGNDAPGGLPPIGTYSSVLPQGPCAGANNCAIVPDPYGVPKKPPVDTTPTISTPDYKDGIIPATIGVSASFLIATTNTAKVTAECTPAQNATITANSSDGNSLIFFISKMPDKDVACTLTAIGSVASTSLPITLKAQEAVPGAVKPTFVGLDKFIKETTKIKHGDTKTITGIGVANQDANAKPLVVSCTFNTPKLVKLEDGTFTLTITNKLDPDIDEIDLCTFLAVNGDGSYNTLVIDFQSTPADPQIIPVNFSKEVPVTLGKGGEVYFAYADDAMTIYPKIVVVNQDNRKLNHSLKCDGTTNVIDIMNSNNAPANTFELYITYKEIQPVGTLQSCVISLTDNETNETFDFNFPKLVWK